MAIESTKTGVTAISSPSGVVDAVVWSNPTHALNNDSNSSSVDFSSSVGSSEYLIVKNFAFNLPNDVTEITGIEIEVKRFGSGEVLDNLIGLTYFDGSTNQIVQNYKEDENFWSSSEETIFYGSYNDNWGRSWSISEINDTDFGFVLAANGEPLLDSTGSIQSITITIYCTQNIEESASGGVQGLGEAQVTSKYSSDVPTGGAELGGLVLNPLDNIDAEGGASCSGEAELSFAVAVDGGSVLGGYSEVSANYSVLLKTNEYEIILRGNKVVPPDLTHGFTAVAKMTLTATGTNIGNSISWQISHPFANIRNIVLLGPANKQTTVIFEGNDDINIVNFSNGDDSPVIGSANISNTQATNIRNGLYYLQLESAAPRRKLRAQVVRENINLSGTAIVDVPMAFGGSVSSGSAIISTRLMVIISGGMVAGGIADQEVLVGTGGGARISGSADCDKVTNISIESSGGKLSADSLIDTNYNPQIDQNGLLATGFGIIGIQPYVYGGVSSSGESPYLYSYRPTPVGGLKAYGYYILQQTYAAQDVKGSGRLGGRARAENLRPLVSRKTSSAYALATPNIINTPPVDQNKIIDRFADTVPELDPNGFRIQHEPGWCEFSQPCGSPLVPDIVKKRQGKYMPDKKARAVMSRQIATMTQSE